MLLHYLLPFLLKEVGVGQGMSLIILSAATKTTNAYPYYLKPRTTADVHTV
jgi:hypothetical protein